MIRALKKKSDLFVSINFLPNGLTLSAIQKTSGQKFGPLFLLKAYTSVDFSRDEYHEGRINNPSIIGSHIIKFLSMHTIKKTPIACTITGKYIIEQFVSNPRQSIEKQHLLIDSYPLYPQDNGDYMEYMCATDRSTILQYQLMAIAHKLNVQIISTAAMAHLNLYRYLNGVDSGTLAQTLEENNNDTSRLVSAQTIASIVKISAQLEKSIENHDEISIALGAIIPFLKSERYV